MVLKNGGFMVLPEQALCLRENAAAMIKAAASFRRMIVHSDKIKKYSLVIFDEKMHNALITATPVIGSGISLIQRRTSAVQALFLCLQFTLWQRAWESRQVRRSLCSGNSTPAYAVALLSGINGGSLQNLTKETVMQTHSSSIQLYVNHIDNIHDLLLDVLDCLEHAADHPDRALDPTFQAVLLRFAQALTLTLMESDESE
mgnify:CR=1 FL=1